MLTPAYSLFPTAEGSGTLASMLIQKQIFHLNTITSGYWQCTMGVSQTTCPICYIGQIINTIMSPLWAYPKPLLHYRLLLSKLSLQEVLSQRMLFM